MTLCLLRTASEDSWYFATITLQECFLLPDCTVPCLSMGLVLSPPQRPLGYWGCAGKILEGVWNDVVFSLLYCQW